MSACLPHTELPCWINKFEHATYFFFKIIADTFYETKSLCHNKFKKG